MPKPFVSAVRVDRHGGKVTSIQAEPALHLLLRAVNRELQDEEALVGCGSLGARWTPPGGCADAA